MYLLFWNFYLFWSHQHHVGMLGAIIFSFAKLSFEIKRNSSFESHPSSQRMIGKSMFNFNHGNSTRMLFLDYEPSWMCQKMGQNLRNFQLDQRSKIQLKSFLLGINLVKPYENERMCVWSTSISSHSFSWQHFQQRMGFSKAMLRRQRCVARTGQEHRLPTGLGSQTLRSKI